MSATEFRAAGQWWPPGQGEVGQDWTVEDCELVLHFDSGDAIDVCVAEGDGERALVSLPVDVLAAALARMVANACT